MADALERLRNRQRPEVPLRDTTLVSKSVDTSVQSVQQSPSVDTSTSGYQESENPQTPEFTDSDDISVSPDTWISKNQNSKESQLPDFKELKQTPRSVDTSTSGYQESKKSECPDSKISKELKTKQSTMRLEAGISDRLQESCRVNGLSREVLIEALFLQCEADSELWQAVIDEAKRRSEHRQQIANLRRAQSMMEKFGSQ